MNLSAVQPSAVLVLLQTFYAIVPVAALTVISWRMGRRAGWLVIPWAVALVVGAFSLFAIHMAMARSPLAGTVTWPYLMLSAVHSASAVALLVGTLVLAVVGCSRTGFVEPTEGLR